MGKSTATVTKVDATTVQIDVPASSTTQPLDAFLDGLKHQLADATALRDRLQQRAVDLQGQIDFATADLPLTQKKLVDAQADVDALTTQIDAVTNAKPGVAVDVAALAAAVDAAVTP